MPLIGKELRSLREKVEAELKSITETALEEQFVWLRNCPSTPQQYWQYELNIWEDDHTWHDLPCGLFVGVGRRNNPDLGIQKFFDSNDRLFNIIENSVSMGAMNGLIPLLQRAKDLLSEEALRQSTAGAALNLSSYIYTNDEWLKSVCNEYILILHLEESGDAAMTIGCQQSERYRIKVPGSGGPVFLSVPFDKVELLKVHERVEGRRNEPYFDYQVALSFAGEDRSYVARVANELKRKKVRVFMTNMRLQICGERIFIHILMKFIGKRLVIVLYLFPIITKRNCGLTMSENLPRHGPFKRTRNTCFPCDWMIPRYQASSRQSVTSAARM